jgi:hypothetical protein
MSLKRLAIRITAAGVLTAAGALALGAEQLSAVADHLEGMVQKETLDERVDVEAEAAARAEGEGYPLGRADGDESPSRR